MELINETCIMLATLFMSALALDFRDKSSYKSRDIIGWMVVIITFMAIILNFLVVFLNIMI